MEEAAVDPSITKSNCLSPVEEAKHEKLRLNNEVDPAVEVYVVVHSVTMVDPDLVVAGTLFRSSVIER